jgi:hypothetical protein
METTRRAQCVAFFQHNGVFPIPMCDLFTVTRLGQLFFLAMSGHAGPIQIDVGVTPVVCRISCGQAAALFKGRRACRTDLKLSSRASDGIHDQPKSRDGCCQPERLHDTSPSIVHQRHRRRHGRLALSRKVDQAEGALFPGWLTRDRVSGPVWRMSPVLAARRKAGRSPGRTANQVRVGRQSATCKSVCGGRPSD